MKEVSSIVNLSQNTTRISNLVRYSMLSVTQSRLNKFPKEPSRAELVGLMKLIKNSSRSKMFLKPPSIQINLKNLLPIILINHKIGKKPNKEKLSRNLSITKSSRNTKSKMKPGGFSDLIHHTDINSQKNKQIIILLIHISFYYRDTSYILYFR